MISARAELPADASIPLSPRRPSPADVDRRAREIFDSLTVDRHQLPTVSVIVPTRNRGSWLPFTLHALAQLVYPTDLVDVIVVDNSSTDDTEDVVKRWAGVHPFPVRFFRKTNEGPAVSRNYGAAQSSADVLAFTDSDCMPDPHWLINGVRALQNGAGVVSGMIVPRRTEDTHFLFNSQLGAVLREDGLYRTASLFVERRTFEEVGGFDPSFALGPGGILLGGEDTDLGWRIKRTGRKSVFEPSAVVEHLATPVTPRQWLMRPLYSQIMPRLVRLYPELRNTVLWHRYFHVDDDFFVIVGAAGIAGAVVLGFWPLALASLGFVWSSRSNYMGMIRRGRLDKAAAILALQTARTALNVGVLAYASVRHRRLVL